MAADVAPPVQAGARPLLSVQGLAAWFGPLRALDRVDLSLRPGELVALAGENGAGKTTLVRCISGDMAPGAGEILLAGRPMPADPAAALRRGVDAITAGEPYVLDVRVATVGTGAESTWHQRFKLRK